MNPAALVFLESPEARRLVASWSIVGVEFAGGELSSAMLVRWSDAANVAESLVVTIGRALVANEIIGPGGVVDPTAAAFVRRAAFAAAGLFRGAPQQKKGGDRVTEPGRR